MGLLTHFLLTILTPVPAVGAGADYAWNQRWQRIPELVQILEQVPEGRAMLRKAEKKEEGFLTRVKLGDASFTETTFSRAYSLIDGKERITLRHEITMNKQLSLANAVVDLAHELVHFTEKGMLDPYRAGFELEQFVRNGIEGDGGELAALSVECRVAWELEERFEKFPPHRLCRRYRLRGAVFDEVAARRDYYALGTWFRKVPSALKEAIPELNANRVLFTSSYAGKPYPLALAEEFGATRQAACLNNRRKYRLIASQSEGDRRPASAELLRERRKLKDYDLQHCRTVGPSKEVTP